MIDLNVFQLQERIAASEGLINASLSAFFRLPAVVHWNRLEGRPRSDDLTRPVRAEVRDPLWMLARQWQFGEFDGDDAGTPIRAKLAANVAQVQTMTLRDGPPQPYTEGQPLEPLVERSIVTPDLMMRLHMGQRWLSRLRAAFGDGSAIEAGFVSGYAIVRPTAGSRDLATLQLATDRPELALRLATGGRSIDGAAVLSDVQLAYAAGDPPSTAFARRGVPVAGDEATLDVLADELLAAFGDALVSQPTAGEDAWERDRLEYNFSLGVPDGPQRSTTLRADGYVGGHLDWYAFDATAREVLEPADANASPPIEQRIASFIPTTVQFAGAPNSRFWEFEDTRVGFGLTTASKTDVVKLLLAHFALASSNDWFVVPLRARCGALIDLQGIVVTDNFGFNTLVEPTSIRHQALGLAGHWGLWTLTRSGNSAGEIDPRLFLAPGLANTLESTPLDEVVFLRDEVANLVWGVETLIPGALGGGRDARAAATQLREQIRMVYPPSAPVAGLPEEMLLSYQLMSTVPENWIPLVAVRLAGQSESSAFLQGAMPRVPPLAPATDGAGLPLLAHQLVLPRGAILETFPVDKPNVIREEELLRGGAVVQRSYQQTRGSDGTTITWSGRRKLNGRGEGSSGLAFDQVLKRPS